MTCRDLTSFIADYIAGDLEITVRQAFERHLSLCSNCVQYLTDYRRAIALGKGTLAWADSDEVPADVPEGLVAAILAARGGPG